MMYSEFLERTCLNERQITHSDYSEYIEPVYMDAIEEKNEFCKITLDAYVERVCKTLAMFTAVKHMRFDWGELANELKLAFLGDFRRQYAAFRRL